jgi:hypothetical protein
MSNDEVEYPDMLVVGRAARKVLEDISKEKLVVLINPLEERLKNRDLLDNLEAYRLVEDIYFCKDNKLPNYLKEKCYSVHVMLPNWD